MINHLVNDIMNDKEQTSVYDVKDFSPESVKKVFNTVEDLCYLYTSDHVGKKERREVEEYLSEVLVWTRQNKNKLKDIQNPFLKSFNLIQQDLDELDNIVATLVTPIKEETIDNWMAYFKSTDAFYLTQGNHKVTEKQNKDTDLGRVQIPINNFSKSVRTEKIGTYGLYMISGYASEDFKLNADGAYYLEKAEKRFRKNLNAIAPSGRLDGEADDEHQSITLYATADLDTTSQNIVPAITNPSKNHQVMFVVNALFNQNYSFDTKYNGKYATLHGTSFSENFEYVSLDKDGIALFNVLPIMALIYNLDAPNKKYTTSDLTKINPFVVGTDTYFLYKKFRDIRDTKEPERTEKLLDFYVDYIEKITEVLGQIKPNHNLSSDTLRVLENTQKIIIGVMENFNYNNLHEGMPNDDQMKSLARSIKRFKYAALSGDENNPDNTTLMKGTQLRLIRNASDLRGYFKRINEVSGLANAP